MKKEYIAPELNVIRFETEDVITLSNNDTLFETPLDGEQP